MLQKKDLFTCLYTEPALQNQDAPVFTEFSLQEHRNLQIELTEGVINSKYRFIDLLYYKLLNFISLSIFLK